MKKFFAAALHLFPFLAFAQDPALAPFYHGVASGDATSDAVIIWTRVSDTTGTVSVDWKMATDTLFCNIVQSGLAETDDTKDYTLKVDVTGLQPDTWYYYQFTIDGMNSLIGRTKTLPAGNNSRVRLAVASCSDYGSGTFFNAYLSLARRNDIHAVIHLGDYIYEYAEGGTSGAGIRVLPDHEIITLDDYRQRYNSYRLDPNMRLLHQQYPFYTVWDDHESANNSWPGGAENHTPGSEGDWQTRKANAMQANFEWLPKRQQAPGDYTNYRTYSIGNLAELIMLDTRLEGRDEQSGTAQFSDTNRTILGAAQRTWFFDRLKNSPAKWKIVGQQVMMAPLTNISFTSDMWDGYQGDRNRIINHVLGNNIENVVILTGDIHSSWANDVPGPGYNSTTQANSAFVEFVCSSITSGAAIPIPQQTIQLLAPHVQYADLSKRGYLILDVDSNRAQSDWTYVSSITSASFTESDDASWYVNEGERFLREASSTAAAGYVNTAPFAPLSAETQICTVVGDIPSDNSLKIYPNPFQNGFSVYIREHVSYPLQVRLFAVHGKVVYDARVDRNTGPIRVNGESLPPGSYLLMIENSDLRMREQLVKVR